MSPVENSPVEPSLNSLSVAFVLLPHFTLTPFASFIDALRLAADEGDLSRQIHCHWTIMSENLAPVSSSSGVNVQPWETFRSPEEFDYIVVVGGLLHRGPAVSQNLIKYLKRAAECQVTLVGLCTGSIALIRAGLMNNRRCCVSWFHYNDIPPEFSNVIPVADRLYVDDGNIITCTGGTAAADLATNLIERHLGHAWARKTLSMLTMEELRPASSPQPEPVAREYQAENKWARKALLLMEQNMSRPLSTQAMATRLSISQRQLERLFRRDTGTSLQKFYRQVRLRYGFWLLQNTNRSITDISQECGFADNAHFSRSFRAEFELNPSALRITKNSS